jgi:hypothetical protein
MVPKGSSPPIAFNYFLLRVVGSIRAGAPKALIPNASFNSSLLFLTIVTNKQEYRPWCGRARRAMEKNDKRRKGL